MTERWRLIAALWPVAMLNYIDRQVIYSLFPLLKGDLHLTDAELGLASTAFLWVYAFASPFTGYLADRVGSRKLLLGSLAIWSAVTWLTGRAGSFAELVGARALMGASEAFYLPAALSLIAAHHPEATRSRATGLHYSGLYLGVILGGVGGGWIGQNYGWRMSFLLLGIVGLAYGCLLPFILPGAPGALRKTPPLLNAWKQLLGLPAMWILLGVFGATSAANWLVYTWSRFTFTRGLGCPWPKPDSRRRSGSRSAAWRASSAADCSPISGRCGGRGDGFGYRRPDWPLPRRA